MHVTLILANIMLQTVPSVDTPLQVEFTAPVQPGRGRAARLGAGKARKRRRANSIDVAELDRDLKKVKMDDDMDLDPLEQHATTHRIATSSPSQPPPPQTTMPMIIEPDTPPQSPMPVVTSATTIDRSKLSPFSGNVAASTGANPILQGGSVFVKPLVGATHLPESDDDWDGNELSPIHGNGSYAARAFRALAAIRNDIPSRYRSAYWYPVTPGPAQEFDELESDSEQESPRTSLDRRGFSDTGFAGEQAVEPPMPVADDGPGLKGEGSTTAERVAADMPSGDPAAGAGGEIEDEGDQDQEMQEVQEADSDVAMGGDGGDGGGYPGDDDEDADGEADTEDRASGSDNGDDKHADGGGEEHSGGDGGEGEKDVDSDGGGDDEYTGSNGSDDDEDDEESKSRKSSKNKNKKGAKASPTRSSKRIRDQGKRPDYTGAIGVTKAKKKKGKPEREDAEEVEDDQQSEAEERRQSGSFLGLNLPAARMINLAAKEGQRDIVAAGDGQDSESSDSDSEFTASSSDSDDSDISAVDPEPLDENNDADTVENMEPIGEDIGVPEDPEWNQVRIAKFLHRNRWGPLPDSLWRSRREVEHFFFIRCGHR